MGFVSESKSVASDAEMNMESEGKGKDNVDMDCKKDMEEDVLLEKKRETMVEKRDSHKSNAHVKHTMLYLDLENHNKDCGPSTVRQQPPQIQQQHQSKNLRSEPKLEKAATSTNSLPLPMNLAGWPAGLPPVRNGMPQVRPQGMASLDGNSGSSNSVQPPGFLLSQPRPKRQNVGRCWQARIGCVAGGKDIYLGTYDTEEEAAEAYDIAVVKLRGMNAITNFHISNYYKEGTQELDVIPIKNMEESSTLKIRYFKLT